MKKGQMISLDLMISIVILMFAVGIIYYFIFFPQNKPTGILDLEENYFLVNFKGNLDKDSVNDFLDGSVIDESILVGNFAGLDDYEIEQYVFGGKDDFRELGINNQSYDVCLFFEDDTGIMNIGAKQFLGEVYGSSDLSTRASCDSLSSNPCQHYSRVVNFLTPVLRDDISGNKKIVKLNLVACVL